MEQINLEQYRGDTFVLDLTVNDSNGDPVSFEDAEIKFTIAADEQITEASDDVEVDSSEGTITITVPCDLMHIDPGDYPFDVEVTWEDEVRRTLVLGTITIRDDVTKHEAEE